MEIVKHKKSFNLFLVIKKYPIFVLQIIMIICSVVANYHDNLQ
jgi:hypothetical protein